MNTQIKQQLYNQCEAFVANKETTILKTIQSHQEALHSETKSSAGDKHETGRAMLQLEMEKASQQLEVAHAMKTILSRINPIETSEVVKLGSLVFTNQANYYVSVSVGEIKIDATSYYAVSVSSPIGKLLLGKKVGDSFVFNREIKVEEVI